MARGRLINRSVTASLKFHNLPDDTCRLMATWTIAFLDMNGVFYGDAVMVKSFVFPRRGDVTIEQVEGYLCEMERLGLIYRFEANGDVWQCWPGFADNQPNLRRDREKPEYPLLPHDCPQDDGNDPATIRQDDGKIPAEEKRSESKRSEEKPTPADRLAPLHVYKEATRHKIPNDECADLILAKVGTSEVDLKLWRAIIKAGLLQGWKWRNVSWMLDYYDRREIPGTNGQHAPTTGPPAPPPVIVGLDQPAEWMNDVRPDT